MDEKQVYLKAAKIIASCPKERLPYVLKTLEQGGIAFDSDEIAKMCASISGSDRTSSLIASRADINMTEWIPTTNYCILQMREAYKKGLSLTKLGRKVGLNRTTLFKYLRAYITPKPSTSRKIIEALSEMFPIAE